MAQEIINYPFDDFDDERDSTGSSERSPQEVFIDRPLTGNTEISYVNGHNLPDDEDEDEEEDDLILGDEDDVDEDDLAEDEIDVEIEEDVDPDVDDADLVLDTDDPVLDDEDEDDL
jgi:hypothetical protein